MTWDQNAAQSCAHGELSYSYLATRGNSEMIQEAALLGLRSWYDRWPGYSGKSVGSYVRSLSWNDME